MMFLAPFVGVVKLRLLNDDLLLFHIVEDRDTKFPEGLSRINIFGLRCDLINSEASETGSPSFTILNISSKHVYL